MLASGGVNADQLSAHINQLNNPSITFEPLLPLSDTDIEGYLKHTHEQTIISAIEEGRRSTQADFYRKLESTSRNNWEKQKEKLFEELGRHQINSHSSDSPAAKKFKGGAGSSRDFERGASLLLSHLGWAFWTDSCRFNVPVYFGFADWRQLFTADALENDEVRSGDSKIEPVPTRRLRFRSRLGTRRSFDLSFFLFCVG
jgi:hypothetical protein